MSSKLHGDTEAFEAIVDIVDIEAIEDVETIVVIQPVFDLSSMTGDDVSKI